MVREGATAALALVGSSDSGSQSIQVSVQLDEESSRRWVEWELAGSWWIEDALGEGLGSRSGTVEIAQGNTVHVIDIPLESTGPDQCGLLVVGGAARSLEASTTAVAGLDSTEPFADRLYLCRESNGFVEVAAEMLDDDEGSVLRGWVYDDIDNEWLRVVENSADPDSLGFEHLELEDDPLDSAGALPFGFGEKAAQIAPRVSFPGGGGASENSCSEADTIVSGRLRYEDRRQYFDDSKDGARYPNNSGSPERGLSHVIVEVWDKDSSTSDDFLGYTVTGPDGYFDFQFNWCTLKEQKGWTESRPDIYTKVHLAGVLPHSGSTNWDAFSWIGTPGWDPFDATESPRRLWEVYRHPDTATILAFTGTVKWNAQPGDNWWGSRLYERWGYSTSDHSDAANAYMVQDFFWEMMASPDGGGSLLTAATLLDCYTNGCATRKILRTRVNDWGYNRTDNRQRIKLDVGSVLDSHMNLHELGHVFELMAEGVDIGYGVYDKDLDPGHEWSVDEGEEEWESASMTEGWASFFAAAVSYERSSTDAHFWDDELEDAWDCAQVTNSHFYPAMVSMSFWDFYDTESDGVDNCSHTLGRLWSTFENGFPVLESGHRQPNVFDWWERYDDEYSDADEDDAETLLVQNCLCDTAQSVGEDDDTLDVCP